MIRQTPWPSPRDSLLLSDEAPFFEVHFLCVDALKKKINQKQSPGWIYSSCLKDLNLNRKKTKQHFCSV